MAGGVSVALADLLRRAVSRFAAESLRVFAVRRFGARMCLGVAVAFPDLFPGAIFRIALQLFRSFAFRLVAAHVLPPFIGLVLKSEFTQAPQRCAAPGARL